MLWRVPIRRSPFGSLMALLTGAAPATPGFTRTRLDEEDYRHCDSTFVASFILTLWICNIICEVCCIHFEMSRGIVALY